MILAGIWPPPPPPPPPVLHPQAFHSWGRHSKESAMIKAVLEHATVWCTGHLNCIRHWEHLQQTKMHDKSHTTTYTTDKKGLCKNLHIHKSEWAMADPEYSPVHRFSILSQTLQSRCWLQRYTRDDAQQQECSPGHCDNKAVTNGNAAVSFQCRSTSACPNNWSHLIRKREKITCSLK